MKPSTAISMRIDHVGLPNSNVPPTQTTVKDAIMVIAKFLTTESLANRIEITIGRKDADLRNGDTDLMSELESLLDDSDDTGKGEELAVDGFIVRGDDS